jgi:hypothetical protein
MKEETKCYCGHTTYCDCGPETLEEAQKQQFNYDNLHDAKEISSRIKVVKTIEEAVIGLAQLLKDDPEFFIQEPKQETLEEVAERLYPIYDRFKYDEDWVEDVTKRREDFIKGAKWLQEHIGKSEFLQKLRATLSDAEARRLIKTI